MGYFEVVKETAKLGRLPVVNFAAGGVATPADAALMMQLGSDGIFVRFRYIQIRKSEKIAKSIVESTTHYGDPEILAEVSRDLGKAMHGLEMSEYQKQKNYKAEAGNGLPAHFYFKHLRDFIIKLENKYLRKERVIISLRYLPSSFYNHRWQRTVRLPPGWNSAF